MIKRIQRDTKHVGKAPSKVSGETKQALELRELQDRLKKSVQSETFEEAAKIRDRIQELQEKLKKGNKPK